MFRRSARTTRRDCPNHAFVRADRLVQIYRLEQSYPFVKRLALAPEAFPGLSQAVGREVVSLPVPFLNSPYLLRSWVCLLSPAICKCANPTKFRSSDSAETSALYGSAQKRLQLSICQLPDTFRPRPRRPRRCDLRRLASPPPCRCGRCRHRRVVCSERGCSPSP